MRLRVWIENKNSKFFTLAVDNFFIVSICLTVITSWYIITGGSRYNCSCLTGPMIKYGS